jgi:membrane protein required for colicin V production
MTWVDAVVLLILAVSGLLAFMRGFVREALGGGAWVGAIYAAMALFGPAQAQARRMIANTEIADPVAFGVVFLIALIVLSIIASVIARAVRMSALGGLDRTMGLLFGILRGAVIVSATYIAAGLVFSVAQWPDAVLQARSLPFAYQGARWIAEQMPPDYTPKVEAPPSVAPTRSGALLQSAPHGFALGGRPPGERGSGDQESR